MKKRKLPATDSIRELAKFWDAHDLTEFEDELEEVSEPVFLRTTSIEVRLQAKDAESVRRIAHSRGVSAQELIRQWVLQKLR
jgi:hypothetical protein